MFMWGGVVGGGGWTASVGKELRIKMQAYINFVYTEKKVINILRKIILFEWYNALLCLHFWKMQINR